MADRPGDGQTPGLRNRSRGFHLSPGPQLPHGFRECVVLLSVSLTRRAASQEQSPEKHSTDQEPRGTPRHDRACGVAAVAPAKLTASRSLLDEGSWPQRKVLVLQRCLVAHTACWSSCRASGTFTRPGPAWPSEAPCRRTCLWPVGPGPSMGTEGRAKVSQPQLTQDHSSSCLVFLGKE